MKRLTSILLGLFCLLPMGCVSTPEGITPVQNFEIKPYLGTWYEIARLDHSFERGLTNVTATYTLRDDGGITVTNRGYDPDKQEWKVAEGKGFFAREKDEGFLKISFFGPFYGSYVIFGLDADYQHAFVTGNDRSYLWLLARSPDVSAEVMDQFLTQSKALGFKTEELIYVNHAPVASASDNDVAK